MNKPPRPLKKRLEFQARLKFMITDEIRLVLAGRYTLMKLTDMSIQWIPDMPLHLHSSYLMFPHVDAPPKPLPDWTPRYVDSPPQLATAPPICNSPTCRFPSKAPPRCHSPTCRFSSKALGKHILDSGICRVSFGSSDMSVLGLALEGIPHVVSSTCRSSIEGVSSCRSSGFMFLRMVCPHAGTALKG